MSFKEVFSLECRVIEEDKATNQPMEYQALSYFNGYRINPKLIMQSYKQYGDNLLVAKTEQKLRIS